MVAEEEREVTDSVNPDKVAAYLLKRELWERADGEVRFNFRVTDSKTKNLNMQAAMKASKDLNLDWASLAESEQKLAQDILDDDNLGEYLRGVRIDQDALKQKIDRTLESLSTPK